MKEEHPLAYPHHEDVIMPQWAIEVGAFLVLLLLFGSLCCCRCTLGERGWVACHRGPQRPTHGIPVMLHQAACAMPMLLCQRSCHRSCQRSLPCHTQPLAGAVRGVEG